MNKRVEDVVDALAKGAETNYKQDGFLLPVLAIDVMGKKKAKEQTVYMPMMPEVFKNIEVKKKFVNQCGKAAQLMMNEGRITDVMGVYMVAPANVSIINNESKEEEKIDAIIITGLEPDGNFSVRGYKIEDKKLTEDKRLSMTKNTVKEGEPLLLEQFYKGLLTIDYND